VASRIEGPKDTLQRAKGKAHKILVEHHPAFLELLAFAWMMVSALAKWQAF
jgi:hypothetical protein